MNYNGIDCPVCGKKFEEADDVVVCPVCGTPHHRACWNENGRCINEEKHIEGFIWQTMNIAPSPVKKQNNSMKICPRCGESNAAYEPVCIRCGERLKASDSAQQEPFRPQMNNPFGGSWQAQINPEAFSPYQNMYAQDARTVYGEDTRLEDIPVTEVAEFVQKDSTKYIGKFLEMQNNKSAFSWNWSAALGSIFWCFYRKLTGLGTAVLAIYFSVTLAASFIIPLVCDKISPEIYDEYITLAQELTQEMSEALESGAASVTADYYITWTQLMKSPVLIASYIVQIATALIISIILGFLGNHFYKKKTLNNIRNLRQIATSSVAYHMYIKQRGGVSVINLMLPILIYSMFTMFTSYL